MSIPEPKRYGSILVRSATQSDFEQMGQELPYRVTAIAGEDADGEVLGVGGIMWLPDGRPYLFTKLREDKKAEHRVVLHIAATKFLKAMARAGIKHAVALPDPCNKDVAAGWLKALGLKPMASAGLWELKGH